MKKCTDTLLFDPNDPREFRKFSKLFLSHDNPRIPLRFIVDSIYNYTKIIPHKLSATNWAGKCHAKLVEVSMSDAHYIIEQYEIDNPAWFKRRYI